MRGQGQFWQEREFREERRQIRPDSVAPQQGSRGNGAECWMREERPPLMTLTGERCGVGAGASYSIIIREHSRKCPPHTPQKARRALCRLADPVWLWTDVLHLTQVSVRELQQRQRGWQPSFIFISLGWMPRPIPRKTFRKPISA